MPDIIKGKASCWSIQEELNDNPYYSDLQAKVMNLLNCGTQMWNNMFCEMRDKGFIVRSKNQQGKAVWMLPSAKPKPVQTDMYAPAPADSGGSPSS